MRQKISQSPRPKVFSGRLTAEERRIVCGLSGNRASDLLGISNDTYSAIVSPHGVISERSIERIRNRLKELILEGVLKNV